MEDKNTRFQEAVNSLLNSFKNSETDGCLVFNSEQKLAGMNSASADILSLHRLVSGDLPEKTLEDICSDIAIPLLYRRCLNVFDTGIPAKTDNLTIDNHHFFMRIIQVADGLGIIMPDIADFNQTEKMLSKSEANLEEVQRIAKIGSWTLDHRSDRLSLSLEAHKILGFDPCEDTPSYAEFLSSVHPDDRDLLSSSFVQSVKTGTPYETTCRHLTKDAAVKYLTHRGETILQGNSIPLSTIGTFQDVTELKTTELKLRASEERWRSLTEHSKDLIWTCDTSFKLVFTNRVETGTKKESIAGDSVFNYINKENREEAMGCYQQVLESGIPCTYETQNTSGNNSSTTTFYEVSVSPIRDADTIKGLLCRRTDITKRRIIQDQLKQQHSQLLSIFNGMDEVIYIADPVTYEMIYMNKPAITNWGPVAGRKCYEVLQGGNSPCSFCSNSMIFGENMGKTHIWEFKNLMNKQSYRCIDRAIRWSDGRMVRFELAIDITDIKAAEQKNLEIERQMQHMQKLESLGLLAGGIAHDFNNILMAVMGNADLALMGLLKTNPAYANLNAIKTAAKRAADLAREMLAYSGRGNFLIEKICLNEAVKEMTHILEVSISKKAVIKYRFADNLPLIEADATQVRQIIMNLVTNASDAIDLTSGIISITTGAFYCDTDCLSNTFIDGEHKAGLYSYVEVSDTGYGMTEETMAKLFDPFFTTKLAGRGLGLSTVLGILRGHNGAIKVNSEPGRGTSFKVLFPACSEDDEKTEDQTAGIEKRWSGTGTILLVDDEETILSVGRMMLKKLGFHVITASDGREALDKFQMHSEKIRLVILDLVMPHLDGRETLRELKKLKENLPVIMSSGYNEQDVARRFAGMHLDGFLHKPYMSHDLESILKQVLEGQSEG